LAELLIATDHALNGGKHIIKNALVKPISGNSEYFQLARYRRKEYKLSQDERIQTVTGRQILSSYCKNYTFFEGNSLSQK
jgi:hypothetical protein